MKTVHTLFLITGAPGSGKTLTFCTLLEQRLEWLFFDGDAILPVVSQLTHTTLATDEQYWPTYRTLWVDFLDIVADNHRTPVLFLPVSLAELPRPASGRVIQVALLDCPDGIRRQRLQQRQWSAAAIEEAISDAQQLRNQVGVIFDTSLLEPLQVAQAVVVWLRAWE